MELTEQGKMGGGLVSSGYVRVDVDDNDNEDDGDNGAGDHC